MMTHYGSLNPNWKGGSVTLNCKECSKPFTVRPGLKGSAKFCSLRCGALDRCKRLNPDAMTSFSRFVERNENGCWLWLGAIMPNGYSTFRGGYGHRFAFESFRFPIPEGLEPDHLCRVRHCVNPFHLEVVTHRENCLRGFGVSGINARKTHCPAGHPYDSENTHYTPSGGRKCRICQRVKGRIWEKANFDLRTSQRISRTQTSEFRERRNKRLAAQRLATPETSALSFDCPSKAA